MQQYMRELAAVLNDPTLTADERRLSARLIVIHTKQWSLLSNTEQLLTLHSIDRCAYLSHQLIEEVTNVPVHDQSAASKCSA